MLEPSVKKYVEELVKAYPQIECVWLFGSRANYTERADSDWDLLAFGSQVILESLTNDKRFRQPSIDLLIVYDSENFNDPWELGKRGSLQEWAWKKEDQNLAMYRATKRIYDEDGKEQFNRKVIWCRALRVYPFA
ncbi:MAG: nucleotidyltransferase domain-containing protein [Methylococcaceae bacterium]|nr:nucleotidyltransferase domain-containing protein [Methylococcaceae bacterium]